MVIEDSREYKAAQELERALNDYSWNPKRFAESTRVSLEPFYKISQDIKYHVISYLSLSFINLNIS